MSRFLSRHIPFKRFEELGLDRNSFLKDLQNLVFLTGKRFEGSFKLTATGRREENLAGLKQE